MDSALTVYLATVGAAPAASDGFSVFALIAEADIVVQLVLFGLIGMSVTCWAIILNKFITVRSAASQSRHFVDAFWKAYLSRGISVWAYWMSSLRYFWDMVILRLWLKEQGVSVR